MRAPEVHMACARERRAEIAREESRKEASKSLMSSECHERLTPKEKGMNAAQQVISERQMSLDGSPATSCAFSCRPACPMCAVVVASASAQHALCKHER